MKKSFIAILLCFSLVLGGACCSLAATEGTPVESGDTSGEMPVETPTESGDTSGETPVETPTESGDTSGETPVETPTESGDTSGETPVETPIESGDTSGETPVETPTESGDTSGETPVIEPVDSGDSSGDASDASGDNTPDKPSGTSSSSKISVSFRLIGASRSTQDVDLSKGKDGYYGSVYQDWIAKKSYSLNEGATVKDLLEKALDSKNLHYELKDTGYGPYISMIEAPKKYGSHNLAEFGNGQYTGWMYTVNDFSPWDGIAYTVLEDGDDVLVYYTNDFRYEMEGYDQWYGITNYDGEFLNAWLNVVKTSSKSTSTKADASDATQEDTTGHQETVTVDLKYIRNAIMSKDTIIAKGLGAVLDINKNAVIENTATTVYQTIENPTVGSVGGDWAIIGISRSGIPVEEAYFDTYYANVTNVLTENEGVLSDRKYTEYARVALAITAIGEDASSVSEYNLLDKLNDYDQVTYQGINGAIYALMALDEANYPSEIREKYLEYILARQSEEGGFAYAEGGKADVDITAMALQVLANYLENEKVRMSCNRAVDFLSKVQKSSGGYESFDIENLESTAQVLAALNKLSISVYDERFVKNSNTVLDAVLSYFVPNQGFKHVSSSNEINQMSTEQALLALSMVRESISVK